MTVAGLDYIKPSETKHMHAFKEKQGRVDRDPPCHSLNLRSRFAVGRHAPSAETALSDHSDLLFPNSLHLFPVEHAAY